MLPKAVSLPFVAGDEVILAVTVKDENGVIVNLSGMTPRFVAVDTDGLAALSTEDAPATAVATITDAAGGQFQVAIAGDDTSALLGIYNFQAELEDSGGDKRTVSRGILTFITDLIP
jgi:hypothetical protein